MPGYKSYSSSTLTSGSARLTYPLINSHRFSRPVWLNLEALSHDYQFGWLRGFTKVYETKHFRGCGGPQQSEFVSPIFQFRTDSSCDVRLIVSEWPTIRPLSACITSTRSALRVIVTRESLR